MYITYETFILRFADGARIPLDAENADYGGYLAWLADGNEPQGPAEPSAAAKRAALKEAATARRWQVETGGITLPSGARVRTAIEDQNRITSVLGTAQLAGVTEVDFKGEGGWLTLPIADVQQIAAAVGLHVQACFSAERAHHIAIDALADEALDTYDVSAGWPS